MKDKDKKGLWKFLLGLLKIIFRVGSKHLEKKLDEDIKKEEAAK